MGTWATGLYAADEASDARDSYRGILSSGLDGALKKKLLSPQPAPKLIRPRKAAGISTWTPGELFSYRLRSGRHVVLCLESIDENQAGELSALSWIGDAVPDEKTLKSLKRKRIAGTKMSTMWYIIGSKKKDVPQDRMVRLGVRISPEKGTGRRRVTLVVP
jgi:hypothetical protein